MERFKLHITEKLVVVGLLLLAGSVCSVFADIEVMILVSKWTTMRILLQCIEKKLNITVVLKTCNKLTTYRYTGHRFTGSGSS